MILAIFDLQVTPMLTTKFQVNSPFVQVKKGKTDFQDGRHGHHLGFQIRMILAYFDLQVTPMLPPSFKSIGFLVLKKKQKIDFQDGHLGFQIRKILAIFDLQVTPMLPTKFRDNWPFSFGEEEKNRFSRRPPWRASWISNLNDFSYF